MLQKASAEEVYSNKLFLVHMYIHAILMLPTCSLFFLLFIIIFQSSNIISITAFYGDFYLPFVDHSHRLMIIHIVAFFMQYFNSLIVLGISSYILSFSLCTINLNILYKKGGYLKASCRAHKKFIHSMQSTV